METDRGKGTFKVLVDKAERRLAVTYWPISKLKVNPKNPRVHCSRQIRQIARSIEAFGFLVPVLGRPPRQCARRIKGGSVGRIV